MPHGSIIHGMVFLISTIKNSWRKIGVHEALHNINISNRGEDTDQEEEEAVNSGSESDDPLLIEIGC